MAAESTRTRRPRLASLFCGGVLTTGVVLWSVTTRLQLTLPSNGLSEPHPDQLQPPAGSSGCECLLQLHCPRYSFDYQQQQQRGPVCTIYRFSYGSAKSCMQWRAWNFGRSTHVVLLGDLRLLFLYQYMRDELMSDTERIEGPAYCRSVHKNWTHSYLKEDGETNQPPKPCHHLSINKLAKLEYYWTDDSRWSGILQQLLDRCRLGVCPSVVVVSSRLDLVLRSFEARRELSLAELDLRVREVLPLLERLRAYGVHVWWKPHENLLDAGTFDGVTASNEIIQQHNLRLMTALSRSSVPVWTSTAAIGWGHHQQCLSGGPNSSLTSSADFRCGQPYYLGNWAQRQYMDIVLNFLCGRARNMPQNPCCAGWA